MAPEPLPATHYVFAEWKRAGVNIDYHVEVEGHYYSVPYSLIRQAVEVRLTASTVEVLHKGQRVASHVRSYAAGKFTTDPAHRPKAHQAYLEWTPSRLIRWAEQTGPATAALVAAILASRPHPEQGYRSCLGLNPTAVSAACAGRQQRLETCTCRPLSVSSI